MIYKIIPSIIAKNQKELNKRLNKVEKLSDVFQLDVMDSKFVKNKSIFFSFKLPKSKYEAHLMIKDPETWIKANYKRVNTIIFHVETTKNPLKIIRLIKSKMKKVGIAINPKTSINKIKPFLSQVDLILVMTVIPGKYGSKFQKSTLNKIKQIRELNKIIDIEVDGHEDPETIRLTKEAGANNFVVGSYLQNSKRIKEDYKILLKLIHG